MRLKAIDNPTVFSVFRIYLGLFLFFQLITSLDSSSHIWSNEGMIPSAALNLTYGYFPNILNVFDDPLQIKVFIIALAITALLFTLGWHRRWAALILWYGLTCLFNRNTLILNPSMPYIGWLLIACVIQPSGEPFAIKRKDREWRLQPLLLLGAWIIFSLGYFLSAIDKLNSASWRDGTAILKIVNSPLGASWASQALNSAHDYIIVAITWLVIAIEMACLPLSIIERLRKWAWVMVTSLQLFILVFLNIAPIAYGMMSIHLFVFNPDWFRKTTTH